jgi:hypothetical protein
MPGREDLYLRKTIRSFISNEAIYIFNKEYNNTGNKLSFSFFSLVFRIADVSCIKNNLFQMNNGAYLLSSRQLEIIT